MEYLLIFVLETIGICLHVAQKVALLDKKYTDKTKKEILNLFLDEDWITLFVSSVVLILNLVVHYIIDTFTPELRAGINYYVLYAFGGALILGYAGQRLIYKLLGGTEKKLEKLAETQLPQ